MAVATPIQIRFERFDGALGIAPASPPRLDCEASSRAPTMPPSATRRSRAHV